MNDFCYCQNCDSCDGSCDTCNSCEGTTMDNVDLCNNHCDSCDSGPCESLCQTCLACQENCENCQSGCEIYFQGCGNSETSCSACDSQSYCNDDDSCYTDICQICQGCLATACESSCQDCQDTCQIIACQSCQDTCQGGGCQNSDSGCGRTEDSDYCSSCDNQNQVEPCNESVPCYQECSSIQNSESPSVCKEGQDIIGPEGSSSGCGQSIGSGDIPVITPTSPNTEGWLQTNNQRFSPYTTWENIQPKISDDDKNAKLINYHRGSLDSLELLLDGSIIFIYN